MELLPHTSPLPLSPVGSPARGPAVAFGETLGASSEQGPPLPSPGPLSPASKAAQLMLLPRTRCLVPPTVHSLFSRPQKPSQGRGPPDCLAPRWAAPTLP